MKILVTPTSMQPSKQSDALKRLTSYCSDIIFNPIGRPLTEDELIPLLKECDGYIAGLDYISEKVLNSCPNLKVISRYGAGYDRVDITAATKNNIIVTNTPGVNSEAVGELAMGLILSIARNIPLLNSSTRNGEWIRSSGMELRGKTIGIVGLGAIGKIVARCATGFNMKVIAYDPYIDKNYCEQHSIQHCTLDEIFHESDVISLHLPLTETTKHLIDENAFKMMKPNVIIINTSRGGLIDEAAAYNALKEKQIGGLGLDAFEIEPPLNSPLFEFSNVVVTPHTGAHTHESTKNMANLAVENLINVLEGNYCPHMIN